MRNGFHILKKVFDRIEDYIAYIAAVLIILMIIGICYEIVLRYFFNRPTLWAVGMVEHSLLWITFLGTGWLMKRDGHVVVDIALLILSDRGQAILNTITSIIGLASCAIMGWYGVKTAWKIFSRHVMTAQDPEIPKFIILMIIPIGFFFLTMEFIRKTFKNLTLLKSQKHKHRGQEKRTS